MVDYEAPRQSSSGVQSVHRETRGWLLCISPSVRLACRRLRFALRSAEGLPRNNTCSSTISAFKHSFDAMASM